MELGEARLRLATARGGLHGGASPERARAASGVRYRLKQLAQKYGGALGVFTVLWIEGKAGAEGSAASSAAMAWVALADESTQRCFGLRISSNRHVESLQRCYGGQEAQSGPGGVELRRRSNSPAVESRLDSGGAGL